LIQLPTIPAAGDFSLLTDLHVERCILGQLTVNPRAFDDLGDLTEGDFSLESHRAVFQVILALRERGQVIDILTVSAELERRGRLSSIGGRAYLCSLSEGMPYGMAIDSWVRILREKTALRDIITLCDLIGTRARSGEDSRDLLEELQANTLSAQVAGEQVRAMPISTCVVPAWEELKREMAIDRPVLGIPTGIDDLDQSTTGWRDGELTYIGAWPGTGKTALLMQSLFHAATMGFPAGCISLEMRSSSLLRRLAVLHSGIKAGKFRDPRTLDMMEQLAAKSSMFALGDLPIWIADQSALRPAQVAALARQMVAAGAKAIFIDFIQVISQAGKDREAINLVSASLRETCKALNVPFVVASQLSRGDKDLNRRPTKQDLRESGNLEQDAHNVILIFRPKDKQNGQWTGLDELILDKQREGVTGIVPVQFMPSSVRFIGRSAPQ